MALRIVESSVSAEHSRLLEASEDEQEDYGQLLPRIPNEISIDLIAAKLLSWQEICTLACVSRGWCHAVRSREVYRARVRLQSTEKLCCQDGIRNMWGSLYIRSKSNDSLYLSPPILGFSRHAGSYPLECRIGSLDGRIFIMGGRTYTGSLYYSNEVYMLDLAGRKQWKPCASMKEARGNFGASVLDGKIYVFGGQQYCGRRRVCRDFQPVCGSEVYDPKQNTWKSIKASPKCRYHQQVVAIGRELVMHGGYHVGLEIREDGPFGKYESSKALYLEAYNPDKDDWRVPSESSDSWARQSTTFADLLKIREVATIKTRLSDLSV